ncbi:MAG: amino acid ABC transporter permease, partial [Pseudorhodobacter sp.]|nr:amino acid ABC transporter permease [Pseudorhodobacter sp.]
LLPLGMVSALPAIVNFSIVLTKETVILSIVTVPELMYQGQRMSAETFRYVEANLALALLFWLLAEARITHHLIERT